jgi:ElaB/YqjD/DUF883 family membrane-anchored ribosome-binding protein
VIQASQQRNDLVFKLERETMMLSALERSLHGQTAEIYMLRRELNAFLDSAETDLRVRFESEKDRATSLASKAEDAVKAIRELMDAWKKQIPPIESACETLSIRRDRTVGNLSLHQEAMRKEDEEIRILERAYQEEIRRGERLREIAAPDLDRKFREGTWQVTNKLFAGSNFNRYVRPKVEVVGTVGNSVNSAMELDLSSFSSAKMVVAKNMSLVGVTGLELACDTYAMDLSSNQITDLKFLASASKLKVLNLKGNKVQSFTLYSATMALTLTFLY